MDPYLVERSSTNYTPTDEEIPRIHTVRDASQADIASLDREIALLQERRSIHVQTLERCHTLLAPVKRVPDDIISSIFLASCVGPDSKPLAMSLSNPAVVVSHVCGAWRSLALSTAPLWSKMAIAPPPHPRGLFYPAHPGLVDEAEARWEACMRQFIDMAQTWISRSGTYPLSIILRLSSSEWCLGLDTGLRGSTSPIALLFTSLIDLACSVASRWERIDIDIATGRVTDLHAMFALRAEDVPLLHTVRLCTDVTQHLVAGGSLAPPTGGLLMGAALRTLNLARLDVSWRGISVNWSALRTLRFCVQGGAEDDVGQLSMSVIQESLGPRDTLELLSNCPNLVQFACAVKYFDPADLAGKPEIWSAMSGLPQDFDRSCLVPLPHLESLTFYGLPPLSELLACIDAPRLRELQFMDNYIAEMGWPMQARLSRRFMGSVQRLGAQLTSIRFTLFHLKGPNETVTRCLESLPHLINLHLDGAVPIPLGAAQLTHIELTGQFLIESLTPQYGAQSVNLCPDLKRFACTLLTKGFTEAHLVEFVASRRDAQAQSNGISWLEDVRVAFGILPGTVDVRSELTGRGVDLDKFTLRIIYPTPMNINSFTY